MTETTERYSWRCNKCNSKLTDKQVKVYRQRLLLHALDVGSCALCGGHAINLVQVQKLQKREQQEARQSNRQHWQGRIVLIISFLFLLAMPGLLVFAGFVSANLQFGMLRTVHVKMKMGAMMITAAACFTAVLTGAAGYISIGLIMPGNGFSGWLGSLLVWLLSLVVMFSMGAIIEQSGRLGSKLYY